jgi:hypothetical protein
MTVTVLGLLTWHAPTRSPQKISIIISLNLWVVWFKGPANIDIYSILNSEHNWKDLFFSDNKINKHSLLTTISKSKEIQLLFVSSLTTHPHLLMWVTSEQRVPTLVKLTLKVPPLLVKIAHWWPALAGVESV